MIQNVFKESFAEAERLYLVHGQAGEDPSTLGRPGAVGQQRDVERPLAEQRPGLRDHEPVEERPHRCCARLICGW